MQSGNNTYWLDDQERIVRTSDDWDRFAQENDGNGLESSAIHGRTVWSFIGDDTTRMWLECLLQLTRLKKLPVTRPYRCDSPGLRRRMKMTIFPEPDSLLRLEHSVVSTETRTPPVHIQPGAVGCTIPLMSRCSICGRVQFQRAWHEPEHATRPGATVLGVVYTVCSDCLLLASETAPPLVT